MSQVCRAQCGCKTVRLEAQLYEARTKCAILKQAVEKALELGLDLEFEVSRSSLVLMEALQRVEEITYDG